MKFFLSNSRFSFGGISRCKMGIFASLSVLLLSLSCSQMSFQTTLFNSEYVTENESGVFLVGQGTGRHIPQDEFNRPDKNFQMDLYEYPNHPENKSIGDKGYFPLVNVNWYEARDICLSHGKRLCTIYEWRQTCFSDGNAQKKADGNFYPYNGDYDTDICVTDTSASAKSGSRANCVSVAQAGSKPGIYDMSGNVWEWVDHDFYGQKDEFEGQQAIVGGYYFSGANARCDLNLIVSANLKNEKTGFRCCRDADAIND